MNLKLAWRNIWRSKKRSFVVMSAIAIGIWAIIFTVSFSNGMYVSMLNSAIEDQYSHIQIHHPEFKKDREIRYLIEDGPEVLDHIQSLPSVKGATGRVLSQGMITSAKGARGINIVGVDPEHEANVTGINKYIVEGSYFLEANKNQILVSKNLAEKLNVKIRSKVVLTFQDKDGNITAGAFRIVGLFKTRNGKYDEMVLFVKGKELAKLIDVGNGIHEIAIFEKEPSTVDSTTSQMRKLYPDLLIEPWRELAPELSLIESTSNLNLIIVTIIIIICLIFGIINTMLMAVLERMRELGMLMAIGMGKVRVFFMIVIETVLVSLVGGPVGLLLGYFTVVITAKTGIDLSFYSNILRDYGIAELVRPFMESSEYLQLSFIVIITALLASIYPAFKAISLKPVEALRKI